MRGRVRTTHPALMKNGEELFKKKRPDAVEAERQAEARRRTAYFSTNGYC